jgi:hypothetical protein
MEEKKKYMICGRYSTPIVIKSTCIPINVRFNVRMPADIRNEFISVARLCAGSATPVVRTVISPTSKLGPLRPLRSLLELAGRAFGGEVGFGSYELSPYPSLEFIPSPDRDCSRHWNWFCVPGSAIYRGRSGPFPPLVLSLSPHISSRHPPKPVNSCMHSLSHLFCALLFNLQHNFKYPKLLYQELNVKYDTHITCVICFCRTHNEQDRQCTLKVKVTLGQTAKAQSGSRGIALLFL